ncbi:maltotransferase domain-containing protein, partial [Streptomyces minutiscleroticus]
MPAKHHSTPPPEHNSTTAPPEQDTAAPRGNGAAARSARRTRTGTARSAGAPPTATKQANSPLTARKQTNSARTEPQTGRIPVLDVRPLVLGGRRPAKAVVGEEFEISATVFREGHDAVAANVVLRDSRGRSGPWTPMRELAPGTDRWGATVSVPRQGRWTYAVEAWGDPVTTWRHHAEIKIPAGIDTELVLEEGALLYERAMEGVPKTRARALRAAVKALRDTARPAAARLAAALTPEVDEVLSRWPLRELVTSSEPLPLLVERERALFGSWYEFFPRSEGAVVEPGKP